MNNYSGGTLSLQESKVIFDVSNAAKLNAVVLRSAASPDVAMIRGSGPIQVQIVWQQVFDSLLRRTQAQGACWVQAPSWLAARVRVKMVKGRRTGRMKSGRSMQTVWVALATGAVSAGVALLFAPQSGARTRRMVRRKAEDTGHVIRKAYERVKESGNGTVRTLAAYRMRIKLSPRKLAEHLTGA